MPQVEHASKEGTTLNYMHQLRGVIVGRRQPRHCLLPSGRDVKRCRDCTLYFPGGVTACLLPCMQQLMICRTLDCQLYMCGLHSDSCPIRQTSNTAEYSNLCSLLPCTLLVHKSSRKNDHSPCSLQGQCFDTHPSSYHSLPSARLRNMRWRIFPLFVVILGFLRWTPYCTCMLTQSLRCCMNRQGSQSTYTQTLHPSQ